MDRNELIMVLKAQQWEKCKGELRALIALAGSHPASNDDTHDRWQSLEKKVNSFIKNIESNGLHE